MVQTSDRVHRRCSLDLLVTIHVDWTGTVPLQRSYWPDVLRRLPLISIKLLLVLFATTLSVATSSFGHGNQVPATNGAGWSSLLVKSGHPRPGSRKGPLWYPASNGRIWLCQRSPGND